jgi:hypothetical protein
MSSRSALSFLVIRYTPFVGLWYEFEFLAVTVAFWSLECKMRESRDHDTDEIYLAGLAPSTSKELHHGI